MGVIADAAECANITAAEQAEAIIRAYCGWHIAPIQQETITCDQHHTSDTAYLPTMRIVGVHMVRNRTHGNVWREIPLAEIGHSGVTYSRSGVLEWQCGRFCRGLDALEVTLTHGFDPFDVPDVIAVAEAVAGRIENDNGVRSQSVNGASVSYFGSDSGEGRGAGLLASEKAILDKYKLGGEVIV